MLDDELTLLDGTQVVTIGAAARLADQDYWVAHDLITERLDCETVLDGARYYRRADALTLVAGRSAMPLCSPRAPLATQDRPPATVVSHPNEESDRQRRSLMPGSDQ